MFFLLPAMLFIYPRCFIVSVFFQHSWIKLYFTLCLKHHSQYFDKVVLPDVFLKSSEGEGSESTPFIGYVQRGWMLVTWFQRNSLTRWMGKKNVQNSGKVETVAESDSTCPLRIVWAWCVAWLISTGHKLDNASLAVEVCAFYCKYL